MLIFRSEEHLERWIEETGRPRGATMTPAQQWRLAHRWYAGRRAPDWRRRTAEEAESVFADCGLTGDFWTLPR
jgi:hypothetical protein